MSKTLFLCFAGTGRAALLERNKQENRYSMSGDCVRVYIHGCQHPKVGGKIWGVGHLQPDLDVAARKIAAAFNGTQRLDLARLKELFGDAIIIEPASARSTTIPVSISKIVKTGFSRGGITTLAVARHVNTLKIPIYLFIRDPVPGDIDTQTESTTTEYAKNCDLSDIHNIKEAHISYGSYSRDMVHPIVKQMGIIFHPDTHVAPSRSPHLRHLRRHPTQLSDMQYFLKNQNVITDRHTSPDLICGKHRIAPPPECILDNIRGGAHHLKDIAFSRSYQESIRRRVNAYYPDITSDDIPFGETLALSALSRRYDDADGISSQLLTLTEENKTRHFIIEMDAIVRRATEKKQLSPCTLTAMRECLRKIDRIMIDHHTNAKKRNHQSLYFEVRSTLMTMIGNIPFFLNGRILSLTRLFLAQNPLQLPSNVPLDLDIQNHQQCRLIAWAMGATAYGVIGIASTSTATLLLPLAFSLSSLELSLIVISIALIALIGLSVCAIKSENSHPRYWTLPAMEKETSIQLKENNV